MLSIKKSIEIKAPASEVFKFITTPENLPVVWPSMMEVSNVTMNPNGLQAFDWVYKMAGIHFHGHSDTVEIKPDQLLVMKNEKGITSKFRWAFEGRGDSTVLTMEADYEIPGALGKLAKPFLQKLNEREAETLLANTKMRLEEGRREVRRDVQPHA